MVCITHIPKFATSDSFRGDGSLKYRCSHGALDPWQSGAVLCVVFIACSDLVVVSVQHD